MAGPKCAHDPKCCYPTRSWYHCDLLIILRPRWYFRSAKPHFVNFRVKGSVKLTRASILGTDLDFN